MEITPAYGMASICGGYLIIIESGTLDNNQLFSDLDKSLYAWLFMPGTFLMEITPTYRMCSICGWYNHITIRSDTGDIY